MDDLDLDVTTTTDGPLLTIALHGRLDATTCEEPARILETAVRGFTDVRLELGDVDELDHEGLLVLLLTAGLARTTGCTLSIGGVSPVVLSALGIARLEDRRADGGGEPV